MSFIVYYKFIKNTCIYFYNMLFIKCNERFLKLLPPNLDKYPKHY